MRLIERNVDCVLRATDSWVKVCLGGRDHPASASFGESAVELFFDQGRVSKKNKTFSQKLRHADTRKDFQDLGHLYLSSSIFLEEI